MKMNESLPVQPVQKPQQPEGFLGRKTTRRGFLFGGIAAAAGVAAAGLVGCDVVTKIQTAIDSNTGNSGSEPGSNLPGTPEICAS